MRLINKEFERFKEKLRARSLRGASARTAIIDQLVAMDADALRRVNGRVFVRLGPDGIAALAQKNTVLRDMAGKAPSTNNSMIPRLNFKKAPFEIIQTTKRWLNRHSGTARIGKIVFGVIISGAIVGPLAQAAFSVWPQTLLATTIGNIPRCPRLSPIADRCIYVTGSQSLTLLGAANLLQLPLSRVAEENPHLPAYGALPRMSLIAVWRNGKY